MRTLIASLLAATFGAVPLLAAETPVVELSAIGTLLAKKCQQCHGPEKQENNLRLDSRDAALAGGDSGPANVPGDAEASLLVQSVRQTHKLYAMPPKEKLGEREITLLAAWVKAGAEW